MQVDLPGEIPLAALALLPSSAVLLALGALLALLGGLMLFSVLAGIAARELIRPLAWRVACASTIAVLLAAAFLFIPLGEVLAAGIGASGLGGSALTGPWAIFPLAGQALLAALLLAFLAAGLLNLSRGAGGESRERLIRTGARCAFALTPFWSRRASQNGELAGEPEFEITMASGEDVEAEERELIENILELGETTVREVMKPRPDVAGLDLNWPPERILREVADARFSRFPVYADSMDDIQGVLHLRDLFEYLARNEAETSEERLAGLDVRSLLKEPYYLPEAKKVDDALRDLQRQKNHMAIVLDEYGGTAGIVSIEDLLEEIVGEIQDEFDDESRLFYQREDGSYIVTAQLPLDDLCDLLGVRLEAEDVETVGGYVVHELGHIPRPQDILDRHGLRITVLSVERKRISRVKVERLTSSG